MREDLAFYKKKRRWRLLFEDICYAWAVLREAQRRGIGARLRVPDLKSLKVSKEERLAILYAYYLVRKLLAGEVPAKKLKFIVAVALVKNMQYTSCFKIKKVLKSYRWSLPDGTAEKSAVEYLPKKLRERIEEEVAKAVSQNLQKMVVY
ncbi:MAG: hypothetical protein QW212_01040 [Nitrososphaerales archaeon]